MIRITLPNGSVREYDAAVSVYEVAASIGLALAKATVAGRIEGVLVDCDHLLEQDARLQIITPQDPAGLEILRRSCASLLAMAVKQLFPGARLATGSPLADGFFFDFADERSFTPSDLEQIEARMHQLAKTNHSVHRLGDFATLCHGLHVPATGVIQAFKLTKVSRDATLQRIHGTCWANQRVVVLTMNEHQADFSQQVCGALLSADVRAIADLRTTKIGCKLREHSQHAVPYLVIVGEKEKAGGYVSLRSHLGEDLGQMSVEDLCERLKPEA